MKRALLVVALTASLALSVSITHAASFTYHGTLQDSGKPAEGSYDIELTLYSAPSGGSVIGGPVVMYKVPVHGGSFNTEADFGPLTQSFSRAYVSVRVRNAGQGDYAALTARSEVTAATASSVCPGAWTLQGNAGNPAGSYLGTADTQPLTFEVNAIQVGQIVPGGDSTYPDSPNIVFGLPGNIASSTISGATIAGGGSSLTNCGPSLNSPCSNSAQADFGTVGGGDANTASGEWSAISGGSGNTASGEWSAISGGSENTASGQQSTVGGGVTNKASGEWSAIGGGGFNLASGFESMVVGGGANVAGGDNSFAAGTYAKVRDLSVTPSCTAGSINAPCGDYGTFVWSDASQISTGSPFTSSGPNQFLVRATGGVGINTNDTVNATMVVQGESSISRGTLVLVPYSSQGANASNIQYGATGDWYIRSATGLASSGPNGKIVLQDTGGGVGIGTATVNTGDLITTGANGAHLTTGGVWTNGSSRTFKEAFTEVDVGGVLEKVLALPVQTWFYKVDHAEGRHMGPMAEDFSQAFGLGSDNQHIGTVDESGVAFAAIQGLSQKVEAENAHLKEKSDALAQENAALRSKLDDINGRLAQVLARLNKLEAKQGE